MLTLGIKAGSILLGAELLKSTQGSGDVSERVLSTLRQITRELDKQSKMLVKQFGLTVPQLIIMKEIEKSGECPMGLLARAINLSQATVTNILDRLCARELTIRERGLLDRRQVFVKLTEKGRELLAKQPSLLHERFLEEFDDLEPWEQTLMLSTMQRVATMMKPDRDEERRLSDGDLYEAHDAPP